MLRFELNICSCVKCFQLWWLYKSKHFISGLNQLVSSSVFECLREDFFILVGDFVCSCLRIFLYDFGSSEHFFLPLKFCCIFPAMPSCNQEIEEVGPAPSVCLCVRLSVCSSVSTCLTACFAPLFFCLFFLFVLLSNSHMN